MATIRAKPRTEPTTAPTITPVLDGSAICDKIHNSLSIEFYFLNELLDLYKILPKEYLDFHVSSFCKINGSLHEFNVIVTLCDSF